VVQQNPKNPRAHYEFALIAAARGPEKGVTKAIAWLEPVIHELKEFFEPNALMCLLYAHVFHRAPGQGKPQALTLAITHLEDALALVRDSRSTPEHIKVYKTLGWLQIKSLEFKKAEAAFARVRTPD
jgi:hypothetical protein